MQIKAIYKDEDGVCREKTLEELIPKMKLLKITISPEEINPGLGGKMRLDSSESIAYLGRGQKFDKDICSVEITIVP